MKRISLLTITTLVAISIVTIGYGRNHDYVPLRYRTRYSPYAFDRDHCGLVPYYLRYSPYAWDSHHNGLVPYWIRYSPYAFSNKHSGLISDYGYRCGYSPRADSSCDCGYGCQAGGCGNSDSDSSVSRKEKYELRAAARRQKVRWLRNSKRQINKAYGKNVEEIISRYLASLDINNYQISRVLKIDNRTVGVDFVLRDKRIIIKYWDPKEVETLEKEPEYKRSFYDRYEQRSQEFCEEYEQSGGKVYEIASSDKKEILAKLQLYLELSQG